MIAAIAQANKSLHADYLLRGLARHYFDAPADSKTLKFERMRDCVDGLYSHNRNATYTAHAIEYLRCLDFDMGRIKTDSYHAYKSHYELDRQVRAFEQKQAALKPKTNMTMF